MEKESSGIFKSLTIPGILARLISLLYLVYLIVWILKILNAKNAGVDEGNLSAFQIMLIIFLCVYFVGLLTGFFKDGLGGIISILSIILLLLYSFILGNMGEEVWFLAFLLVFPAIPSLLYLNSWYLMSKKKKRLI